MKIRNTKAYLLAFLCSLTVMYTSCNKDEELAELYSNAGNDFIDIENDGYVVTLNAQAVPTGQTGIWRIYQGENGVFENANDPHSLFYGEPGEVYLLGWEVGEGNRYEASTITVSFLPMTPVITIDMPDTTTNNISIYLKAQQAMFGAKGKWELISGNGRIENPESNDEAIFIGKPRADYTIRWKLTYGSKVEYQDYAFTTDELKANAGEDRLDIKTSQEENIKYHTLEAYLPAGASAMWNVIDGNNGRVLLSNNPASLFQGEADDVYAIAWKVIIDEYVSTDTVKIHFRGKWGVWKDERDNQTYRFAEINGLEWMADNYNYAASPGVGSFYYGYAYRGVVQDGHPVETEEDQKKYGRLYTLYEAIDSAPDGWRIPSAEEYNELVILYGGELYAKNALIEGGDSGLEISMPGLLSFSSGADPAYRNLFVDQDVTGMYWTSEYFETNGSAIAFLAGQNMETIGLTVFYYDFYALPVRYVREVQN